ANYTGANALYVKGDGSIVSNNVITNTSVGINVSGDYSTVQNNQITKNFTGLYGIYTEGTHSQILGNTIANDPDFNTTSNFGIYNEGTFGTINGNTITNVVDGIFNNGYTVTISGNTIDNSQFIGNWSQNGDLKTHNWQAININCTGDNAQIIGNTILNNNTYFADTGIYSVGSNNVLVKDNK